jgi:hypothetical protein
MDLDVTADDVLGYDSAKRIQDRIAGGPEILNPVL